MFLLVPFASKLINYSSRTGSLKTQGKVIFYLFFKQNRCQIEFSRTIKDSIRLKQLTKSSFNLRAASDRPLRATWAKTGAPTLPKGQRYCDLNAAPL